MKILPRIFSLTLLSLALTNCSVSPEKIKSSIVIVKNKSGHGTGFFVHGKPGVCSVLTAAHVLPEKGENFVETNDRKVRRIANIERHSYGIDLALVTFQPEGNKCNYPPLKIGNSESLKILSPIYISGFPARGLGKGRLVYQTVKGEVSGLDTLAEGYGISYRAFTVGGMSGAPVMDRNGKVVAVHGMSDVEIVKSWASKQSSLSPEEQKLYQEAVNRVNGDIRLTFSWGIPISWFQESDFYDRDTSSWSLWGLFYGAVMFGSGSLIYSMVRYFQLPKVSTQVNELEEQLRNEQRRREETERRLRSVQNTRSQTQRKSEKPPENKSSNLPKVPSTAESKKGKLFTFEVLTVNDSGNVTNRTQGSARQKIEDLGNGIKLEMVYIPGGSFIMGSPENEAERLSYESPQHKVTLQPFYMSKYPITQNQYQAIMGNNPSHFKGGNRPVEQVSWNDATEFCQKLSQKSGKIYRLPSESQWEYACRAGTTTPFYFGETITSELVNYDANYPYGNAPQGKWREETTDVGSFPPNAFGLYDMHGNVLEWCQDVLHKNYNGAPTDGSAWETGGQSYRRLLRGGCCNFGSRLCRSASRFYIVAGIHVILIGFRVVSSVPVVSPLRS
ncbi:MAG: SUMF1/EgtB/PvdO family nonheme iron enzyme [Okeania sp. SIO3I5]|uniref:SUMF1/EgtB/PvdO family nonheme iron enzyme n=1 Tax=Okeania sp. SIO3I5 TaxID=2607805 RepID=UPI0013B72DE9|nr:SUMF1/EgtB/PvdO family nonheme iron enzyme [Okeania sp. SIO3I5]NEQ41120.1 SUMF1/EgtB/PvdO family nonheme iron enzyme [Okeania sp. SIO3I5]